MANFSIVNISCRYSSEVLQRGISNEYLQVMFLQKKAISAVDYGKITTLFRLLNTGNIFQGLRRMVLVVNFFEFLKKFFFCFVVAICDLQHDVEAIHGLC